jgi:CheY-like chemotaxis protein
MAKHNVLIIDDRDEAREFMSRLLTEAGFEVFEQGSPIGATRVIIRHGIRVVVIDVNMPAMRGDKLAQLFRENPRFQNLGLVLVSGEQEEELQRIGQEVGADAVVTKASMTTALAAEVQRIAARNSNAP